MTFVTPVWQTECSLGEGPVWSVAEQALWFVDIKGRAVYRYHPGSQVQDRWQVPDQPGFVFPSPSGAIVGMAEGLNQFDPVTGSTRLIVAVEADLPGNRLNDAVVAPDGSLWFGSMDDAETAPTGQLFRWDGRSLAVAERGIVCTNGPALCPEGKTFYHTDTFSRFVFAYDHIEGRLFNKRVFLDFNGGAPFPDGTTVDAEGGLWIGFFFGGCARRFDASGCQTHEVTFPVSNVTKIALGGADLRTAYATTARHALNAEQLAREPLAGALFSFGVDVPGIASPLCCEPL